MSALEKALRAALDGKELSWDRLQPILERFGADIKKPSGGSHYKVKFPRACSHKLNMTADEKIQVHPTLFKILNRF